MEAKMFKLISGEEIITRIEEETENNEWVVFIKPMVLMVQPNGEGQFRIQMVPFVISDPEGNIKMKTSVIAGEIENPADDMVRGYLEQTTGLALV